MIEHLRAKGQATGVRPNIQRADRRIYSKMIDVGVQSASIVSNRICKIGKKVSKVTNDDWSDRRRGRACFWADLSYSATDRKRTRERVKKTQKKRKREKSRGREKERKRA